MYICKDCGKEYKEKIEYCDCGNNTFDFIEDIVKLPKKPLTLEQKSEIISKIFFVICILLSILVWCIPVKEPVKKTEPAKKQTVVANIPNINTIWDDTPIYQPKKDVVKVQTGPIVLSPIPVELQETTPKPVQVTKSKQVQKPVQKVKTEPQAPTEIKKVKQKSAEGIKTKPQTSQKPVQTSQRPAPKKPAQNVQKPSQQSKVSTPAAAQTKPAQQKYNPNSQEMLTYKGNLRSALFSKLPVASIQGSGECEVSFSVDLTGKLTNRKFVKESDNKSLNDAVYYMLMSMPRYKQPPVSYNGSPIRMHFLFNNGNYEISIH